MPDGWRNSYFKLLLLFTGSCLVYGMLIALIVAATGQASFDLGPNTPAFESAAAILGILAAISGLLSGVFAILWLLSIFRRLG
jgi:hypothetical protein